MTMPRRRKVPEMARDPTATDDPPVYASAETSTRRKGAAHGDPIT